MPEMIDSISAHAMGMSNAFDDADLSPVSRLWVSQKLPASHQESFQMGRGPDGEPWAPNAESTQRRKGHGVVLVEEGDLERTLTQPGGNAIRDTFNEGGSRQGFAFGTSDEKAAIHQSGTRDGRLPARPVVGMTESQADELAEDVADHLLATVLGAVDTFGSV